MYEYIQYLFPMVLGWFFSQMPKVIYTVVTKHPKNLFQTIMSSGGMPSTHTAAVIALVTRVAIHEHFKGPLFALAFVFSFVTMYDAFNVRLACGHTIERVNQMTEKLYADDADKPEPLPLSKGHTFPEVAVGFCIGVAVGVVYSLVETHIIG